MTVHSQNMLSTIECPPCHVQEGINCLPLPCVGNDVGYSDDKCAADNGGVCDPVSNTCVDCLNKSHCRPGQICKDKKCIPDPKNALTECEGKEDCSSCEECIGKSCVQKSCPDNHTCINDVCVKVPDGSGKCPPGYVKAFLYGVLVCLKTGIACEDGYCDPGYACVDGTCVPDDPSPDDGDPCSTGNPCGDGKGCVDGNCIDCDQISCEEGCPNGCYCKSTGKCGSTTGDEGPCINTSCSNGSDCGPDCGCNDQGFCEPCFGSACGQECDALDGCHCPDGICEGDGSGEDDCDDEISIEKGDCDLTFNFETDECCACDDITIKNSLRTRNETPNNIDYEVFKTLYSKGVRLSDSLVGNPYPEQGIIGVELKIFMNEVLPNGNITSNQISDTKTSLSDFSGVDNAIAVFGKVPKVGSTISRTNKNYRVTRLEFRIKSEEDLIFPSLCVHNFSPKLVFTVSGNKNPDDVDVDTIKMTPCRKPLLSIYGTKGNTIFSSSNLFYQEFGNEVILTSPEIELLTKYGMRSDCGCNTEEFLACGSNLAEPLVFCDITIKDKFELINCGQTLVFLEDIKTDCDVLIKGKAQYDLTFNGTIVSSPVISEVGIVFTAGQQLSLPGTTAITEIEMSLRGDICDQCRENFQGDLGSLGVEATAVSRPCAASPFAVELKLFNAESAHFEIIDQGGNVILYGNITNTETVVLPNPSSLTLYTVVVTSGSCQASDTFAFQLPNPQPLLSFVKNCDPDTGQAMITLTPNFEGINFLLTGPETFSGPLVSPTTITAVIQGLYTLTASLSGSPECVFAAEVDLSCVFVPINPPTLFYSCDSGAQVLPELIYKILSSGTVIDNGDAIPPGVTNFSVTYASGAVITIQKEIPTCFSCQGNPLYCGPATPNLGSTSCPEDCCLPGNVCEPCENTSCTSNDNCSTGCFCNEDTNKCNNVLSECDANFCITGDDCGENCGCLNNQCIPCSSLSCAGNQDCQLAGGCDCDEGDCIVVEECLDTAVITDNDCSLTLDFVSSSCCACPEVKVGISIGESGLATASLLGDASGVLVSTEWTGLLISSGTVEYEISVTGSPVDTNGNVIPGAAQTFITSAPQSPFAGSGVATTQLSIPEVGDVLIYNQQAYKITKRYVNASISGLNMNNNCGYVAPKISALKKELDNPFVLPQLINRKLNHTNYCAKPLVHWFTSITLAGLFSTVPVKKVFTDASDTLDKATGLVLGEYVGARVMCSCVEPKLYECNASPIPFSPCAIQNFNYDILSCNKIIKFTSDVIVTCDIAWEESLYTLLVNDTSFGPALVSDMAGILIAEGTEFTSVDNILKVGLEPLFSSCDDCDIEDVIPKQCPDGLDITYTCADKLIIVTDGNFTITVGGDPVTTGDSIAPGITVFDVVDDDTSDEFEVSIDIPTCYVCQGNLCTQSPENNNSGFSEETCGGGCSGQSENPISIEYYCNTGLIISPSVPVEVYYGEALVGNGAIIPPGNRVFTVIETETNTQFNLTRAIPQCYKCVNDCVPEPGNNYCCTEASPNIGSANCPQECSEDAPVTCGSCSQVRFTAVPGAASVIGIKDTGTDDWIIQDPGGYSFEFENNRNRFLSDLVDYLQTIYSGSLDCFHGVKIVQVNGSEWEVQINCLCDSELPVLWQLEGADELEIANQEGACPPPDTEACVCFSKEIPGRYVNAIIDTEGANLFESEFFPQAQYITQFETERNLLIQALTEYYSQGTPACIVDIKVEYYPDSENPLIGGSSTVVSICCIDQNQYFIPDHVIGGAGATYQFDEIIPCVCDENPCIDPGFVAEDFTFDYSCAVGLTVSPSAGYTFRYGNAEGTVLNPSGTPLMPGVDQVIHISDGTCAVLAEVTVPTCYACTNADCSPTPTNLGVVQANCNQCSCRSLIITNSGVDCMGEEITITYDTDPTKIRPIVTAKLTKPPSTNVDAVSINNGTGEIVFSTTGLADGSYTIVLTDEDGCVYTYNINIVCVDPCETCSDQELYIDQNRINGLLLESGPVSYLGNGYLQCSGGDIIGSAQVAQEIQTTLQGQGECGNVAIVFACVAYDADLDPNNCLPGITTWVRINIFGAETNVLGFYTLSNCLVPKRSNFTVVDGTYDCDTGLIDIEVSHGGAYTGDIIATLANSDMSVKEVIAAVSISSGTWTFNFNLSGDAPLNQDDYAFVLLELDNACTEILSLQDLTFNNCFI